jgi:hypothetical protein
VWGGRLGQQWARPAYDTELATIARTYKESYRQLRLQQRTRHTTKARIAKVSKVDKT